MELAPESRNLTTFTTHVGLRRYKRLIFGISCAAIKFQAIIRDCIEGLEGARNISDDIIVFAKTQEEHDRRLKNVLQRLREKNITLNKSKCEFNKNSVEFFGYCFSAEGVSADPKKIDAIKSANRTLVYSVVFSDWPIMYFVKYRTSQPLWLHYALLPTKTQHGSGARRSNLHLKNSRRKSAVK